MNYNIVANLKLKKKKTGMTFEALSSIADVPAMTIKRIFSQNKQIKFSFEDVYKIATALGYSLELEEKEGAEFLRRKRASSLASNIVKNVQSSSGLENQGLPAKELDDLKEKLIIDLLSGPRTKLWQDI